MQTNAKQDVVRFSQEVSYREIMLKWVKQGGDSKKSQTKAYDGHGESYFQERI